MTLRLVFLVANFLILFAAPPTEAAEDNAGDFIEGLAQKAVDLMTRENLAEDNAEEFIEGLAQKAVELTKRKELAEDIAGNFI